MENKFDIACIVVGLILVLLSMVSCSNDDDDKTYISAISINTGQVKNIEGRFIQYMGISNDNTFRISDTGNGVISEYYTSATEIILFNIPYGVVEVNDDNITLGYGQK